MKTDLVTLTWLNLFTENRVILKEIIFQCVHLFSMICQIVYGSILNLNVIFLFCIYRNRTNTVILKKRKLLLSVIYILS